MVEVKIVFVKVSVFIPGDVRLDVAKTKFIVEDARTVTEVLTSLLKGVVSFIEKTASFGCAGSERVKAVAEVLITTG